MKKRLITASILIAVMAGFLALQTIHPSFFDIVIVAIGVFGAFEVSRLLTKMGKVNYQMLSMVFAVLSFIMVSLCVIFEWNALILFIMFVATIFVLFVGMCFIPLLFKKSIDNNEFRISTGMKPLTFTTFKAVNTMSIFIYPLTLTFFMYFINHISGLGFNKIAANFGASNVGLFALLLVIVIATFTDTMAFFTGRTLKGPKLCPKVSPNKTISGAIGGLIGGVVGAVCLLAIFRAIYPAYAAVAYWQVIIVGIVASVCGQCGDLFESYLKRRAGVKDSGTILPGHGGVMDRVDAILFVVPIVFVSLLFILA